MLNLDSDINWNLFSEEERKRLSECYQDGDPKILVCLPEVPIDTPEKEKEIEKMVLDLQEVSMDSESKVAEELNNFWRDVDTSALTPELEKEWQDKIDKEVREKQEAIDKQKQELGLKSESEPILPLEPENAVEGQKSPVEVALEEPEIKPLTYKCEVCQLEFKSKAGLILHSRIHNK